MKSVIIVVSDLHVGSHTGLMPADGFMLDNGAVLNPSKAQKMLITFWQHFWDEFVPAATRGCREKMVVINGDAMDGNHHDAVDLIPNIKDQRRAAFQMLEPIRKKYDRFVMLRGTEVHGGKSEQDTEELAEKLKAVVDPDTGNYSWYQYWVECQGVLFQFAHHIGTTSSAAYETSAPMRELVSGLVESAQWGQRMPDVFVRSHRHRYIPVRIPSAGNKDISLFITPAWQLRTPHVERIDRMRLPHIGGVIFICEDGICREKRMIYEMPKPVINQM
ncbi:MAG: hypothetical protein C0391_03965 [Anaerolinea sp.]|nr:hypothetical protein [Anaerolinea sp.]